MLEDSRVLELMCLVKNFTVNYETHEVVINVPDMHCADMGQTIGLFTLLDPEVHTISFYQEGQLDTVYKIDSDYKWHAY